MESDRCPRIICETWTPGNHQSPDGPAREMHHRCVYIAEHFGSHWYGVALEVQP